MIGIYLGESFDCLPTAEIRRLQRVLRVILVHPTKEHTKRTIKAAMDRLGIPFDFLQSLATEAQQSFDRLLGSFGVLAENQLSERELTSLQKNPYTLWPTEHVCTISGEALQRLAVDHRIRRQHYLFAHMYNLIAKDRKGWARWLGISDARNDRERLRRLYREAARLQLDISADEQEPFVGRYLDEFFPDNPVHHPMAWYFRDVLGLYDALSETETKAEQYDDHVRALVRLLKAGRLVVKEEPPQFGQRQRHRLVASRERPEPRALTQPQPLSETGTVLAAGREQLLFS